MQVTRCNDLLCAGGDEAATVVDLIDETVVPVPVVVMELDASGNPVIAYGRPSLAIVRCRDPACGGGDETIHLIDTVPTADAASLQFDASGMPVVLYDRVVSSDQHELRLVHCNDWDCTGGDEAPIVIATSTVAMSGGSMRLDRLGNPIISYTPQSPPILKVMRCNDDSCRGGDETTNLIDATSWTFETELRLHATGNPIIAYIEQDLSPNITPFAYDLRLARCATPDCSPDTAAPVRPSPQDPTGTTVADAPTPGPPTLPATGNTDALPGTAAPVPPTPQDGTGTTVAAIPTQGPMLPATGNTDAFEIPAVILSVAGVLLMFAARRRTNNATALSPSGNKQSQTPLGPA